MASYSKATVSVGGDISTLANISALRNHLPRGLRDGASVIVSGQIEPGDKNGGVYIWQEGNNASDDGLTVIKPVTSIATGRWVLSVGRGIARRTIPADATDPSTTQALVNAIAQLLREWGVAA